MQAVQTGPVEQDREQESAALASWRRGSWKVSYTIAKTPADYVRFSDSEAQRDIFHRFCGK